MSDEILSPEQTMDLYRMSNPAYTPRPIALSPALFDRLKRSLDAHLQSGIIFEGKYGLDLWGKCTINGCENKMKKHSGYKLCWDHLPEDAKHG